MARRELPLCPVCGTWSPDAAPSCGHARDPRFSWQPRPWWDGLGDFLLTTLFMIAVAVALIGVGPLLWSIFFDWPPQTIAELFGVLGMLLVTGPTSMVGLGLLMGLPEHYKGRAWLLHDAGAVPDDTFRGEVWLRGQAPAHGGVTRTVRTAIAPPDCSDMSSTTASWSTGEPRLVVAAALAGLAARGQIALSLLDTTGWTARPRYPPSATHHSVLLVRALSEKTAGLPWFEVRLLQQLTRGDDLELDRGLRLPVDDLAFKVGYSTNVLPRLPWCGKVPSTVALREALIAGPPALDDPAPIAAVLAAWRARDPERVGAVLDLVADIVDELLPTSVAVS